MTLFTLIFRVAIAAVILTGITGLVLNRRKNWLTSYLQNFCGILFIFSGWVKAVDPLGTAYKMVDYFDQFEAVFQGTWFKFIAPAFPLLSAYAIGVAVFVIVFEIVLGFMLVIGHKPKMTAWAFFSLVLFFTVLTGFTYLTGYVPGDVNFFDFGGWAAYDATNMKVTDCGCFGDFIKLEPKVSFFKDIFLLVPALYFLFRSETMHQLFTHNIRNILVSVLTIGLVIYCFSNFLWDLPHEDFRPFREAVDIAEQKRLEEEAMANVQILAYHVTNKVSGEEKTIPYAEYLKTFKQYPEQAWDLEQITSEPSIPTTKISDFDITSLDHEPLNERILNNTGYTVLIIANELYGDGSPASRTVNDTMYVIDTLLRSDGSVYYQRNIKEIATRTEPYIDYQWKEYYAQRYNDVVIPFVREAKKAGWDAIMIVAGADESQIEDFHQDLGLDVVYAMGDDKLLKTIIRSNPGIVLMKEGKILKKWHYAKLPKFNELEEDFLSDK